MGKLQTEDRKLSYILEEIYKWKYKLPDFQRPFVWRNDDIIKLLESILEDSFIWAMLIFRIGKVSPFRTLLFDGVKELNYHANATDTEYLVMDWQQRLTALFYAIYWPNKPLINYKNPYKFFIKIDKLLERDYENDNIPEDTVISYSIAENKYKSLLNENNKYNIEKLVENKLFPFSFCWSTNFHEDFDYDDVIQLFTEEYKEEKIKLKKIIKRVENFEINILKIEDDKINEVVNIFEKMNSTGVKLSTFDLLTAKSYNENFNLRKEREETYSNNNNIKSFSWGDWRDAKIWYYIIQSLYLSQWETSLKANDILKNANENIINKELWNNAVDALEHTLNKFSDIGEYWIDSDYQWISYRAMLIIYISLSLNKISDIAKIKQRYWSSLLLERYGSATESKLYADYHQLVKWINWWDMMSTVISAQELLQSENFSLSDKTYSWSAIYKAVFNNIFMNKPWDFYNKDDIIYSKLDDHHIFPIKFLERKWIKDSKVINTVLNKTLIFSSTNKSISDKSPHDYINEMIKKHWSKEEVINLFEKHFINKEMFDLLCLAQESSSEEDIKRIFEDFKTIREKLIQNRFKELLNIKKVEVDINIDHLLKSIEEDKKNEFKSTLRWNTKTDTSDGKDRQEHSVIKSIAAFLNTHWWQVIVGIEDNKNIYGLEKDYNLISSKESTREKQRDLFKQRFDQIITNNFWDEKKSIINISIQEINQQDIAIIYVEKSNIPTYIKQTNEFYIRWEAWTKLLEWSAILNYIKEHFNS